MKKFKITVNVDEDILRSESKIGNAHDAIMQEAGWMHDSGIFVESVSEVQEQGENRKFTDLTKEEIRQIIQDIFSPKRITNIVVHKRDDEITAGIYTDWYSYDDDGKEEITTVKDDITLRNPFDYGENAIYADFSIRRDDFYKLKQFCYAKGIYGESIKWMANNPYLRATSLS